MSHDKIPQYAAIQRHSSSTSVSSKRYVALASAVSQQALSSFTILRHHSVGNSIIILSWRHADYLHTVITSFSIYTVTVDRSLICKYDATEV